MQNELPSSPSRFRLGPVRVDLQRREAVHEDCTHPLTEIETKLLGYLAGRPGVTATREQLLEEVWGYAPGLITRAPHHAVTRLRRKLEVDPSSPEYLVSVYGAGYRLEPFDPTRSQAVKTVSEAVGTRSFLSDRPSAFVGRAPELARLDALTRGGGCLTNVVGPGGVGKTRLCLRFAAEHASSFPGGTALAELEGCAEPEAQLAAVASGLGLDASSSDPVGQLGAALKARGRMLVILDDLQGPAPYLQAWLAGAPETCFLVTGRSRLELAAAQSLPLAPLPTSEGLELLQHRVRALGLEHGDDLEENRTATALVEKLDGLPLAIELAAGRLKLLGVSELLERLDERFEVLRGRAPGIDPRKSTLRGVLQASWTQLSPWEQLGLAQCSVFPASFTLAAAEAVVDVAAWDEAPWAMDVLQSLQDRSLLQVEAPEGGRTRFRLLHSIRDYAAEQLLDSAAVLGPNGAPATGPSALAAARSRHCSHYAVLGSPGRLAALDAPGALEPVRRLLRERDNLLTALDSAIEQGSSQLAANAAAALQEVARLRGPLDRVDARIDRILVLADLPLEERVRLATRRSDLRVWAGRVAEARADLQELRATVEPLQRAELEAPILDALGRLEVEAGDLRAARPVLEAALLAARSCGASEVEALAQMSLGSVHQSEGRVDLAEDCFRAALETMQACGNSRYAGVLLLYLGSLDMERGRLESARLTFEGALASTREVGARRHEASALGNLGTVFLELGQLERARELTEAALAAHREVGTRRLESVTLGNLGTLCMALGKPDEAQVHYRQSIALQEELGNRGLAAIMRGNLAELHLLAGRLQEAEEALTQALSTCVDLGMEAPEGVFLAMLGELRSLSGDPEGADEALDRGEQLLRKTRRRTELGKLLCRKGRIAVKRGEREAAAAALAEASGLAAETQVTEDSDLGRAVQALRDALEAKAAT